MKPVNLLPERHRPRRPTGGGKGSSYILLGALGAVLIAAVAYVMTVNSINSAKGKIAAANAEAQRDTQRADQLGAYGDFDKIKAQRVASVQQLANARFDWERLVRELSRVLPDGVWLTSAAAAQSGTPNAAGGTPSTSSSTAGSGTPSLIVDGCAPSQSAVAVTLVRLHEIQGATDVQLAHSSRPAPSDAAGAASSSGGSNGSSCGTEAGHPNFSFEANVTLSQPSGSQSAPAYLGGGS